MFFMPQEKKFEMLKKKTTLTCLNKFSRKRRARIFCKIFNFLEIQDFFGGMEEKMENNQMLSHIMSDLQ